MPQAYGTSKVIYYNVDKRKLCDAAGTPLAAGYDRLLLTSFGKYVLKITFLNDDGTAADDWSGQVAFWGAIDNNFNHSADPYVSVLEAHFNVTGDWVEGGVEQPNPETGKLCCRLDLSDSRLDTSLGTSAGGNYELEIHGLRTGAVPACILRIPLYIENVQQTEVSSYYPSDDDVWVSHADLVAVLAYYLNMGSWHGDWDNAHNYVYGDVVREWGHIYLCIQTNVNEQPSESADTEYWVLMLENGTDGVNGIDGSVIYYGSYAPEDSTGNDGDFYVDGYYYDFWGPKASGTWGSQKFSMLGQDGADGSSILHGTSDPAAETGKDTDLYINTANGYMWYKSGGAWSNIYKLENVPWENDDIDTGIESLVEFDAPDEGTCWRVYGIVGKAATGQIAFDMLISLRVEGASKTVKVSLEQTTADGSVTGLAWGSDVNTPYTDYDSGSDKVRVRVYVPSDNWSAKGKYVRGE